MFDLDKYCLEGEIWKPIPDYEGIYEASNLGRIRTVDCKMTVSVRNGKKILRFWNGKILKNKTKIPCDHGYQVTLWKNKNSKDWLVARLVCIAFHGVPENMELNRTGERITVNHKDGNRFNNKPDNLEWLTIADNIRHAFDTGLMTTCKKIVLISPANERYEFDSMASASTFLNRNKKYVSLRIKKNGAITSSKGEKYTYELKGEEHEKSSIRIEN